jgi:hypothetical protein
VNRNATRLEQTTGRKDEVYPGLQTAEVLQRTRTPDEIVLVQNGIKVTHIGKPERRSSFKFFSINELWVTDPIQGCSMLLGLNPTLVPSSRVKISS